MMVWISSRRKKPRKDCYITIILCWSITLLKQMKQWSSYGSLINFTRLFITRKSITKAFLTCWLTPLLLFWDFSCKFRCGMKGYVISSLIKMVHDHQISGYHCNETSHFRSLYVNYKVLDYRVINIFREQRQIFIKKWIILVSVRRDPEIQNTWNFSNMIALNISICIVWKFFAKSFTICVLAAKVSKMMIET